MHQLDHTPSEYDHCMFCVICRTRRLISLPHLTSFHTKSKNSEALILTYWTIKTIVYLLYLHSLKHFGMLEAELQLKFDSCWWVCIPFDLSAHSATLLNHLPLAYFGGWHANTTSKWPTWLYNGFIFFIQSLYVYHFVLIDFLSFQFSNLTHNIKKHLLKKRDNAYLSFFFHYYIQQLWVFIDFPS